MKTSIQPPSCTGELLVLPHDRELELPGKLLPQLLVTFPTPKPARGSSPGIAKECSYNFDGLRHIVVLRPAPVGRCFE